MSPNAFRTMNDRAAVMAALIRADERDTEKGGCGMRTTREVADYTGFSLSRTRRHLDALFEADQIDAFDDHPPLWRVKNPTSNQGDT